jgi:hypothetical protein
VSQSDWEPARPATSSGRATLLPWWREALAVGAGYLLYQVVQIAVAGSKRSAVSRAEWLWGVERHFHLDPEGLLNRVVSAHHWLALMAGLYYGILHFAVTPAILVWVRFRRRSVYEPLRNILVVSSVLALVVYWVWPLAPPRLAVPGIVDTLKVNNILSAGSPTGPASLANQYAAMPSLHVAWAVWVALALLAAWPVSRWRVAAWAYPVVTTLVVLGTGNHFLMDAVAGLVLVGGVALVVARSQPLAVDVREVSAQAERSSSRRS